MKKILIGLVGTLVMFFLYFYQSPIISTGEAINKAEKYLLNPPEEWRKSISFNGLEEIPPENISVNLTPKHGYWNEMTNKMKWEVTIKYTGQESTIVMDAYTGELINLYGPLN
ncbi:PepSY domain-containing protein [Bacillus sp. Cr_A10]|uniref:PepSY domain-containing protein n=1 Tax=Bacillus sp. Cr_A10 TaxID=3033993 RepID=UPI0023DA1695|nr:PepSY domain-containing protein [Bacillus sp. Cr_A10]MDF2066518.1 PepSY domain-containing protein [Bacillus sp. Cr_A10]